MALVTKVKAANITNLSDARYCAGMGVDWIGFPVKEIDPTRFAEITGWLSGPQWVIELNEQPWPSLEDYPAQIWQCASSDFNLALALSGKLMVQLQAQEWLQVSTFLKKHTDRIEAVILTGISGGEKAKRLIAEIAEYIPVLVDMNSIEATLAEIMLWPVEGIQLHGSSEERPGLKDYSQLADVLEQLESDV